MSTQIDSNLEKLLKLKRILRVDLQEILKELPKDRQEMLETLKNLHFDHDLPFSKGGISLTAKNVRLLCMKHNLEKSDAIV